MENLIFHYTGAEALKSIILNQSFWITKSDYLNDSTEQAVIKQLLQTFFKEQAKMSKEVQKYISEQLDKYLNDYNHYILSFSQSDDSLPLWNYYSQNEGYSVGIDKSEFISQLETYFRDQDSSSRVVKTSVGYVQEFDDNRAINDLLLPFIHFTKEDLVNKSEKLDELALELAKLSFSIKHSAYSSEKEERIVIICTKDSEITKKEEFRVLRGSFIPYIVFNKEKSPDLLIPIKKIMLSPYHTLDVTKKSVLYLLSKKYEKFIGTEISKSEIPSRY
ncbi:DUF2971 domain-containing protein [Paenibacillus kribbensis]|uniref:DUF2971 domain-containing protein n=1 Tax=Paenibacillus kribbensis TaxID=172713 RepID=UPI0015B86C62|nr:DUF2971 domain-containing protein [Paenibacillus kribbensis]